MSKKFPALTAWSFTYGETVNNELPPADLITGILCDLDATHYAFQMERGTKKGRLHWQGNVKFKKPISGPDLRKAFKAAVRQGGKDEWRYYGAGCLTTTATHSVDRSTIYCLKEETRVEGSQPHIFPTYTYLGKDLYSYDNMFPWQQGVYNKVVNRQPDERAIYLIVDHMGNTGKSTFTKGLGYQHDACVVPLGLTSAQMKSAIVGNGPRPLYVIDLPRNNRSYVEIFDTIEEVKRGFVISCFHGKLQQLYMSRPHVVCFANEFPDLSMLSMDMWRIYTISSSDKTLVPCDKMQILRFQRQNPSESNSKVTERFLRTLEGT